MHSPLQRFASGYVQRKRLDIRTVHKRYNSCDSGVMSDAECATRSATMSSSSDSDKHGSWSSLNYSFSDMAPSSGGKYSYSTGSSSRSTGTTSISKQRADEETRMLSFLPELSRTPWLEDDILHVLQKGEAQTFCEKLSIECLQRFAYILQRVLVRIAREAQRLSDPLNKCSKQEIRTASKIILSQSLFESCDKYANQAVVLYTMCANDWNSSKSSRAGLTLSVGKHHRWMMEAGISRYVHDTAAVYLAACLEGLIEQTILVALSKEDFAKTVITTEMLDTGINKSVDLYGLYHSANHLLAGRDAAGARLPNTTCLPTLAALAGNPKQRLSSSLYRSVEANLVCTCVGSLSELGDTVNQAMYHWCNRTARYEEYRWTSSAMTTLYHFMRCTASDCCDTPIPLISIKSESIHRASPPVMEWIRIACAFTSHRGDSLIDHDDVLQAARVLLPNMDCPVRHSMANVNALDVTGSFDSYQRNLALAILSCGRSDLIAQVVPLLGKSGIDSFSEEGLTALMYACWHGDDARAHALINQGATLDVAVPPRSSLYPRAQQTYEGWTALCFAVACGHVPAVQLLLDVGCKVDGSAVDSVDNTAESPLQLAAAMGRSDIVSVLLNHSANPYLSTALRPAPTGSGVFNAFTLAASHGHRLILQKLFRHPISSSTTSMLSLSEILAEGNGVDEYTRKLNSTNRLKNNAEKKLENEYMVIENDYVSIEDLGVHDLIIRCLKEKLDAVQISTLQHALYNASEHGYLDIALEVHTMGLPWNIYTWYMSLRNAHTMQRKAIIQSLLTEFEPLYREANLEMIAEHCLPLMFAIFRDSRNEIIGHQLASIFSRLFGPQPVPLLKECRNHPSPSIDASYVDSPDLSDITFIVEGKSFFAHKIILANASTRFKAMLTNFAGCSAPEIEINDISYQTFEMMMKYLYGGPSQVKLASHDHKSARNLLGAAHYFQLEGLKRKCEIVLSKALTKDNCVSIYKSAKMHGSEDLMEFCEAFFIQHFSELVRNSDSFKRIIYSNKLHNRDLLDRLSFALVARLSKRLPDKSKCAH